MSFVNESVIGVNSSDHDAATLKNMASMELTDDVRIALYSIIFILSVVGNSLVITTLAQNRRMRTVTNVFLMNLAVSDLLLAVFCMPFRLIPTLLKDFVFGSVMCVLIRYLQGVSVCVSVLTLVSISLERYFAICRPLHSRSWQTLSHAYKTIAVLWVIGVVIMVPVAVFQKLVKLRSQRHKCIEFWSSPEWEKAYTVILDLSLLVLPILLMSFAYGRTACALWKDIKFEFNHSTDVKLNGYDSYKADVDEEKRTILNDNGSSVVVQKQRFKHIWSIRSNHATRNLHAKKRVIKMLFVVVLEFFICWTPVFILNTWIVWDIDSARRNVSPLVKNLIHLLAYISSCCNPITYCFMNRKFRQCFIAAFCCCTEKTRSLVRKHSDLSLSQSQRSRFVRKPSERIQILKMQTQNRDSVG